MKKSNKEQEIIDTLEKKAPLFGIDIVDVECKGASRMPTVSVRIDKLEDADITLDEVTDATTWISDEIEALDPYKTSYNLEVSSPGIERPLRRPSDFAKFKGEKAKLMLEAPIDTNNRRKITGVITEADDNQVVIETEDKLTFTVDFENVLTAHALLEVDFTKKKGN